MSDDQQEIARLQRLNAELKRSLQRCRDLVAKWRSQVAANSNALDPRQDDDKDARSA
jgi:hypothetical protein